jgi:hypothetical protein
MNIAMGMNSEQYYPRSRFFRNAAPTNGKEWLRRWRSHGRRFPVARAQDSKAERKNPHLFYRRQCSPSREGAHRFPARFDADSDRAGEINAEGGIADPKALRSPEAGTDTPANLSVAWADKIAYLGLLP